MKFLVGAAAFVVSAAIGVGVLVVWGIVLMLVMRWRHPAAGAVGIHGGLNDAVVVGVPLVCGAVGAFLVLRKYSRGPQS